MPRYVAFLRAINVGGHTVKMERLRAEFAALGFSDVETFIASGNVIFTAASKSPTVLEKRIAAHLRDVLGYEVGTFVRTAEEVVQIAAYQPFAAAMRNPYHALYISFLPVVPPPAACRAAAALSSPHDDLQVRNRELYWLSRRPFGESTISAALLERTLGMPGTVRNVTTVRKIAAKLPPVTTSVESRRRQAR